MKITYNTDKIGTIGLFITAIFSPCCFPLFAFLYLLSFICFPLFAFVASALGLGSFELFGGWTMWVFQAMVIVAIFGLYISYRKHKCLYPLLVAIPSGLLIFYGYHFNGSDYWTYFLYVGMFGLLAATIWNYKRNRMHDSCDTCITYEGQEVELKSTITCPKCGHKKEELMPTDACQYFYECEKCNTVIKPKQGDCCVYCSYGSMKCPPIQVGNNCC